MKSIYRVQDLQILVEASSPMLMLDRAVVDSETSTAQGVKAVSTNEEFFNGHFPGNPIMPGVLQVAAMSQLGTALIKTIHSRFQGFSIQAVAIERVKFRKPVFPGDFLEISASLKEVDGDASQMVVSAETMVDGQRACQAVLTMQAFNPDELRAVDDHNLTRPLKKFAGVELNPEKFFSLTDIAAVLPHRYPFLLLDRVLHLDPENSRVLAIKNTTGNEPFFSGLKTPVVPLFLLAEMAAQAGCFLALQQPANEGKIGFFMAIDQAVFQGPVNPGDQLLLDSRMIGKGRFGKGESELYVGESRVAEIAIKFAMVDA